MAYRILSLDGGGSWALIQVRTLIQLYGAGTTGHAVLSDFDLVAANSGGSIVLGGLVEDLPLGGLLAYFEDEAKRRSIFSPTKSWGDHILQDVAGIGPKYSVKAKLAAFHGVLPRSGNKPLREAVAGVRAAGGNGDVRLLIVGFDYDRNRAVFFRSAASGNPEWGRGDVSAVPLAEAIHASTNAPVNYFDGPAELSNGDRYWDGGVTGCNNPVLAAVTEALTLGVRPTEIAALSLGTATVALPWAGAANGAGPYVQQPSKTGVVNDLRKLASAILDDPPDVATFVAHTVTGGGRGLAAPAQSRIVRMNPLICPVRADEQSPWTAPGRMTQGQFSFLVDLDMDAVEQNEVDAIASYAGLWLDSQVPNQPIRMDGDTLQPEIGYRTFAAARQAWETVRRL